ncbi:hypothetical protein [Maritalea porphyrae]|jgi:hypothetical protein|uniref:hypothetical protein n=1 Tax=Maritalea porphyrae TaxID=880732 RepID=UPI0022AFE178|nr:hypothetical protein [Maritalea porphyrae]MCZ4272379.1 hypothetical protein [Maritalea porphyrae]
MLSIEIIKRSFFATINNFDTIYKISAFWVPLMVIAGLPLITAGSTNDVYTGAAMPWIMSQSWPIWLPLGALMIFVTIVGAAIVAIAWHRFLVLGEVPKKVIVWPEGWPVQRYFWTGVVLFIVPMILAILVSTWAVVSSAENGAIPTQPQTGFDVFWPTFAGNFVIYLVFLFWGLKLPAIALEKPTHHKPLSSFKFRDSFHYTRQHFVQILILALAFSFILTLINSLQAVIFGASLITDLKTALGAILSTLLSYLLMFFTVGLLSELYKALVQEKQMQEVQA